MNYDEDGGIEEQGFRVSEEDDDDFLEPPIVGGEEFDANEFEEEDPDKDH